jgi:hypothetical protein
MAIKELFYDNRPQVLLDPLASQRIDPRFKYTRGSTGTYVDVNGIIQTASANEPRFNYDLVTGESLGLLLEEERTNLFTSSNFTQSAPTAIPTNWFSWNPLTFLTSQTLSPDGVSVGLFHGSININGGGIRKDLTGLTAGGTYYLSYYVKGLTTGELTYFTNNNSKGTTTGTTLEATNRAWFAATKVRFSCGNLNGTGAGGASTVALTTDWRRVGAVVKADSAGSARIIISNNVFDVGTGNGDEGGTWMVWGAQFEAGSFSTSYITTTGSTVTRAQDLLSVETPLPATGSIYIDARAIGAEENDTLLSLKNDSNDKIDLAYLSNTATYNSLALIANYDGVSKSSLPLPVPTTDRERNIITYGANNYQYGRDSSRFAPSLSSSVPTNLNKLSIGHDAVDPTKAFNGYINTVYAWSGELTREVAEALVRGEIDPINADTYNPTGPAGSLALVINTQGAAANGEKTFTLPAESVATDNDIVITWGDGAESGLDGAAAELGAIGLTHDYPSAGIYPVWVEGKMQNIKYNNISNADDLLLIAAWGTGDTLTSPSTMNGAFYGCGQMDFSSSARNTNRPNTSAVTDWTNAFRDCSSITGTFPSFDFTAATTFSSTWRGCSSLASVPAIFVADGDVTQNVTSFGDAWRGCSSLTSFPLINTSSGTSFSDAWSGCNSLTSFPLINTSSGTSFSFAWYGCNSLTSFPLINTLSGISFGGAWQSCNSLTSFPLINTSSGTSFSLAWRDCSSLTSFPLIDTSSGTNFSFAWYNCNSLASFPLINTSSGTNFSNAWYNCSSLTSFPLINTSSGTNFSLAWNGCSSLTSFPLIDTSSGTNFSFAWYNCNSLTSFPLINTSSGTNFSNAWYNCSSLTSFPLINTSSGTNFSLAWNGCSSLTSFPLIDTSSGTNFSFAWYNCNSLASFPLINTSSGTNFSFAWYNCSSLTDFPAGFFDSWAGTPVNQCFYLTWDGCSSLTATSVDNILVSIAASNVSAPSGTGTHDKKITIDYDGTTLLGTTATAIATLKSRNWDIYLNGVEQ